MVHKSTSASSIGKIGTIDIEIFKEAYNLLLQKGEISRDYINQNYTGRASIWYCIDFISNTFFGIRKESATAYI